jgi:CelD/BcsL family acetyltransferase involved in cellulose biosynthesis
MADGSHLSHRIVRDDASFDALGPEWEDLFRRGAVQSPFLRYAWLRRCWDRQRSIPGTGLFIVVVCEDTRAVLIAPFVVRRSRLLFERLAFLDSLTPQYNDVLVEGSGRAPRYVEYLWTTLRRRRRLRRFLSTWVRADSPLVPHLAAARQSSRVVHKATFIDLTRFGDFEGYLHSLPRNLRADHGRQLRNLEARGTVELRMADDTTCSADMAWLFAYKRDWVERRRKASRWLKAPATEKLFTAVAREGLASGRTWLLTLRVDGTTIAAELGFREGPTLYLSKLTYDPAWHTYSPARTLILLTIRRAFEEGLRMCDFMIGGGSWKDRIAPGAIEILNQRIKLQVP